MASTNLHSPCRPASLRGFTLTEIVIVLGIIGILLSAIWVAAYAVQLNNRVQTADQQTAFILAAYKSLYSTRGIDTGAVTDVTCLGVTNSYFPGNMANPSACSSGTTSTYPLNPWGGYVQVFADSANQGIQIGYYNLTREACIQYASKTGNGTDIILEQVSGNSTGLLPPAGNNTPFTVAQVNANCANNNTNSVILTFRAR